MRTVLVLCLLAAAIGWWPGRRLVLIRMGSAPADVLGSSTWGRRWTVVWPGVLLGAAFVALVPALWWTGPLLAVAVIIVRRRDAGRVDPLVRNGNRRSLAVTLELVAACLAAGMVPAAALTAVLDAVDPQEAAGGLADPQDPLRALGGVAALLAVGADAGAAWQPVQGHPDLGPLGAAALRTAHGGVALAGAFRAQAQVVREDCAQFEIARAGKAGVLMTAPLGACFLPAFLCLGLAPVVVALLGTVQL